VLHVGSGLLAPVPAGVRRVALVAVALLGLLRELGVVRLPLPQNARQIPQEVLHRDRLRGSARFGFELGTGVRTYVSATAPYVLAAAVLLLGQDPAAAVAAGLGFGAGRAATPLLRRLSGDPGRWDADLVGRLPAVKLAAAPGLVAGALLV
jgi:hypothetical protein